MKVLSAAGWAGLVVAGFLALGCATDPKITRMAVDEDKDLSGRWNDTDSRLVSQQMVQGLFGASWLGDFTSAKNKKPVVIVGTVRNLSSEHIETDLFIKDIERELINSGKVKFVASKHERDEVRDERLDMQSHASEETAKRIAAETGADFMLKGGIKTQIDAIQGKQIKYYQVDLELINLESSEKSWMDTKKIKKFVQQPRAKW
jgi:uncharacterized protein (TIGR02722 family)